jgi:hypothetical protein
MALLQEELSWDELYVLGGGLGASVSLAKRDRG